MIYSIAKFILKIIFTVLSRWEIYGLENIPATGAAILAPNHTSFLDPLLIGTPLCRKIYFLARSSLFHPWPWAWLLKQVHSVPVDRARPAPGTIKKILSLLKSDEIVVMFPEGTRGTGRQLGEAQKGLGIIVARSGAPVIPAYISGARTVLPQGAKMLHPGKIKIVYGSPLTFGGSSAGKEASARIRRIGNRVMREIAELGRRLDG